MCTKAGATPAGGQCGFVVRLAVDAGIAANPVVDHLPFIGAEDAEHFGLVALQQFPEAAFMDRLVALDPAGLR